MMRLSHTSACSRLPAGRKMRPTNTQRVTRIAVMRAYRGGPNPTIISLLTHVLCKAKQAPEEKPAGVSQETLAISGLAVAVLSLGVAAITLGYMVGAVSSTLWLVAAASLPACMSNPTLPLQSSSELKSELVAKIDSSDAKIDSLNAKFSTFNEAYISLKSTTERVIVEVDNLERLEPRRRR